MRTKFLAWLEQLLHELFYGDSQTIIIDHTTPSMPETIPTPPEPATPSVAPPTTPQAYDWSTTEKIRHSQRVIGDEYNMTWLQKDLLNDICRCESQFNIHAYLVNNPHSIDRGLFQWNNLYHPDITDAIAYDPEKATRLACKAILAKKAHNYWSASQFCWNKDGKYNSLI